MEEFNGELCKAEGVNWDVRGGLESKAKQKQEQEHTILAVLEARERLQARGIDGAEGLSRRCHRGGHRIIAF